MMWFGGPWAWNIGWFELGGIGMMIIGLVGFILFAIGIVYVLKWIFTVPRYERRYGGRYGSEEEAFEVLKMRYAKGEISKEEYERMKREIGF